VRRGLAIAPYGIELAEMQRRIERGEAAALLRRQAPAIPAPSPAIAMPATLLMPHGSTTARSRAASRPSDARSRSSWRD